jgi:hypothetical protein
MNEIAPIPPFPSQRTIFLPSFDFVLFAPLTNESAKQAINRLRELPGVDAENSRASVNKGELRVRIKGSARLTPDDVYNAIHAVGIDAHFARLPNKPR